MKLGISSTSGLKSLRQIADQQAGPTCLFEALEKIILMYRDDKGTNLVEKELIATAVRHGALVKRAFLQTANGFIPGGYSLDPRFCVDILGEYGISAYWFKIERPDALSPLLAQALDQNRGVLIPVDAHYLDQKLYRERNSLHAIVVFNYCLDSSERNLIGYVGLDSNLPSQDVFWSIANFQAAVEGTRTESSPPVVLITDHPVPERPGFERCKYWKLTHEGWLVPVG